MLCAMCGADCPANVCDECTARLRLTSKDTRAAFCALICRSTHYHGAINVLSVEIVTERLQASTHTYKGVPLVEVKE